MLQNRLKLNNEKTHILTVGTSQRLRQSSSVHVSMNDVTLEESTNKYEQLLGLSVQSDLKWHQHVLNLQRKLKTRLAGLWKLRLVVPLKMLKTIIDGIFNSTLTYCLPVFGGCEKGDICSIQVIQNKAAQIATRSPPRFNRHLMFDKLDWLSVNQLIVYHTLITVYKIRSSSEPKYLATKLNRDNQYGRIILPKYNLELAERGFITRGSRLWNSVPATIRTISNIGSFKRELKKWTKENIPRFLD